MILPSLGLILEGNWFNDTFSSYQKAKITKVAVRNQMASIINESPNYYKKDPKKASPLDNNLSEKDENLIFVYEGDVLDSKRAGQGKITFYNHDLISTNSTTLPTKNKILSYHGHWHNDKKNGYGEQRWLNNCVYRGYWRDDRMDGFGVFTSEKHTYTGLFKQDKRHGPGQLEYPNGRVFQGHFQNNKRHGEGRLFYKGHVQELVY